MLVVIFLLASIILVTGAIWFLFPFALRKVAEKQLETRCRESRSIVLSYDDGPGSDLTLQLLDELADENILASFFVLGKNTAGKTETLCRLIAAGHDVGTHTFLHTNAWKAMPWVVNRDIVAGISVVQRSGGHSRLFRPPFGKMTLASLCLCKRLGLQVVWWTVDSRDSWNRRPVNDVLSEIEAKGGGVVLMHDFDDYVKAPQNPRHADHVISLTREIIAFAKRGNYRIIPYSSLGGENAGQVRT
jgi:peptidoglycan-N-acetylglucosamine deacetylase